MIWFMYFIFGVAHADLFFLSKLGPNISIFKGFTRFFFQNYWIATQVININWIPLHFFAHSIFAAG